MLLSKAVVASPAIPDAEEEEDPEPNPGVDKAHLLWADPKTWEGPKKEEDYCLGRYMPFFVCYTVEIERKPAVS
jgi:hypothetical protein